MKYHYIYKIKNLVNGKIYIGLHSTENLDDRYMCSGKILSKMQRKRLVFLSVESAKYAMVIEKQLGISNGDLTYE